MFRGDHISGGNAFPVTPERTIVGAIATIPVPGIGSNYSRRNTPVQPEYPAYIELYTYMNFISVSSVFSYKANRSQDGTFPQLYVRMEHFCLSQCQSSKQLHFERTIILELTQMQFRFKFLGDRLWKFNT